MSNKRRLTSQYLVRMTDNMMHAIEADARQQNITASSLIRKMLDEKYSGDTEHFEPVKAYRKRQPLPDQDVIEVAKLRESIAELCGSLVHNSIRARSEGDTRFHTELEDIIPLVRKNVLQLDRLKKKILQR